MTDKVENFSRELKLTKRNQMEILEHVTNGYKNLISGFNIC